MGRLQFERRIRLRHVVLALRKPLWAFRNLAYQVPRTVSPHQHIFVLGPPRSGTTLVKQLIQAHSRITGYDGESYFFFRYNLTDLRLRGLSDERLANIKRSARDAIDLFDKIALEYCAMEGTERFVEKSPEHAMRIRYLLRKFPKAQFVFVARDGRDGYLSALRNPRVRISALDDYALTWKECVRARAQLGEDARIYDVKYEDLCADPETVVRGVMDFLGLPFEPGQLDPNRYRRTYFSERQGHERLRDTISDTTVGHWRSELDVEMQQAFERIAGPELRELGYLRAELS